jgi:hypothetical protein
MSKIINTSTHAVQKNLKFYSCVPTSKCTMTWYFLKFTICNILSPNVVFYENPAYFFAMCCVNISAVRDLQI